MPTRQRSYLLRLLVPDTPGSLGAVATALGAAGIDIVSLEVVERADDVAVDDLVVALPEGRLPDSLITVTQSIPGVQVESLRPFAGPLDTHRELVLLEALGETEGAATADLLVSELPPVFHSGWAAVLEPGEEGWRVAAASAAAPTFEGVELPWMPLGAPVLLPSDAGWLPERWQEMAIEMMAVPVDGPLASGGALVLGRSGGPAFRRSELLRLAHLAGLAGTVGVLPAR